MLATLRGRVRLEARLDVASPYDDSCLRSPLLSRVIPCSKWESTSVD